MNNIEQSTDPSTLNFDSVRSGEALPIIRCERRVACPKTGGKPISQHGAASLPSDCRSNQQRQIRHHKQKTALSP